MNYSLARLTWCVLAAIGIGLLCSFPTSGILAEHAFKLPRQVVSDIAVASTDDTEVPNPAVGDHVVDKIPGTTDAHIKWVVIPPAPIPLDWQADAPLEHAIEATHIKFDHEAGGGTDALNIRWTRDFDLDHKGDGAGVGEYVPDLRRNEPVAYVCSRQYTIKVRFEAKLSGNPSQVLDSAMIRAEAHSVELGCLEMAKQKVYFKNGVSVGSGSSEYVEFSTTAPMINWISTNAVWFRFRAEKLLDSGGLPCDDTKPDVLVDSTSRIDVYTVLDDPGHPWYTQGGKSEPWVSALFFATYKCGTSGYKQVLDANREIVDYLFSVHGLKYDRELGKARYAAIGRLAGTPATSPPNAGLIDLESYILRSFSYCNCHDQMGSVTVLANLVGGDKSFAYLFDKFGYIPVTKLVGGYETNNPFNEQVYGGKRVYDARDIVGQDDLRRDSDADGDVDRSLFGNHAFVIAYDVVHDACAGPFHKLKGFTISEYLDTARDRTTEDEKKIFVWDKSIGGYREVGEFATAGSEARLTMLLKLE